MKMKTVTIDGKKVRVPIDDGTYITLQPIAMRVPNTAGIYAPNKLRTPITISRTEFLMKYSDKPHNVKVSFFDDGISNPVEITAYGIGLDCWYILG